MKRTLAFLLAPSLLFAEAGVLIPSNLQQPDPAVLSLAEMNIRIRIDNHHARVETRQIFASHSGAVLEGNYTFALPGRALISDFAIWDGVTRIPGVILERKQAAEIYNMAKMQAIDPGLLQMGERDADQVNRSAVFSAHIVPIPPFGTKRVELEYQERLQTEQLQTLFAVPAAAGRLPRAIRGALDHLTGTHLAPRDEGFRNHRQGIPAASEGADPEPHHGGVRRPQRLASAKTWPSSTPSIQPSATRWKFSPIKKDQESPASLKLPRSSGRAPPRKTGRSER